VVNENILKLIVGFHILYKSLQVIEVMYLILDGKLTASTVTFVE